MTGSPSLIAALHSDAPASDRADRMGLYGQFVGRWSMDIVGYDARGVRRPGGAGEIHFGWVLEGRAIQDVWFTESRLFYGTTLRVYDPGRDAWHILWIDPVKQAYRRMIGRARGADIVQDGTDEADNDVRWMFTEITGDSFHWIAERSADHGGTWQRVIEFFARRVNH